ncbi:leucine-rich repeat domain-containing protein [Flagellimonas flava]|uniref:Leucine-rich repeat (LRR) protein n=1 Tax=Flagellimonas flava TaxID=570519 RepID=A0A1M5IP81_9FLAO|nr:hypothetical protein [Allomuricauda flava]SHG30122.1 hypothetical protein SAMN04488116_0843 [Allomuricauda flava]
MISHKLNSPQFPNCIKLGVIILILLPFVFSCSSDSKESEAPLGEGNQVFRIDFEIEITPSASQKNLQNMEPVFALISISDNASREIYTREKFPLNKIGDNYETDEILLTAGNYSLTEFLVIDANEMVVSVIPMQSSALSQLSGTALPFQFNVEEDKTKISSTKNIEADGYSAADFGYSAVDYSFPLSTDFFTLTVDDSDLITEKTLVLKSLTGSSYTIDWGDGTIEDYISTQRGGSLANNELKHTYPEQQEYTISISGPLEVVEHIELVCNDQNTDLQSNLTSADVSELLFLKECNFYAGQLSTLDTSQNAVLEVLSLGYNRITSLDFSNNSKLKTAWLRYNQLTDLDVSQNLDLEFLWVTGNQIADLDVSKNTKLEKLLARENQLTSIDILNNPLLSVIDLSDNSLSSVDISNNPGLVEINFGNNNLTSIDLSTNTGLNRIDLYGNQISTIDISSNQVLRDIYINDNLLSAIDLSNNPALERLIIENNEFSTLDLTPATKLFDIEIGGNQFDGVQLGQIVSQIHEQAVANTIRDGYMDFKNNPGSSDLDNETQTKLNELINDFAWLIADN